MSQVDFDEFGCRDRQSLLLDWRNDDHRQLSDCEVVINNGAKKYSIHLEVACCSSKFFFKVASGSSSLEIPEVRHAPAVPSPAGELQIKTQDGATTMIGSAAGTLLDLKQQVRQLHSIPESQQRIFMRQGQGEQKELDEEWRTLSSCGVKRGDTLLLVLREPWQRTDATTKTVHLTLADGCVSCLEGVLDYMYWHHRDPRAPNPLPEDLSPEAALGTFWLAGRLEMAGLEQQVAARLEAAVGPHNAHLYLEPAVRLGFVKVRDAAMRLAAAGLEGLPAGACDGLPLDAESG